MSASLKVVKSSALLLSLQFVQRGLGVVSTLILARLLSPEHFGVVALVVISIQFFELLVETGNQQYIVQKQQVDDDDLNTAWSMDIAIKSAMAVLIMVVSPAAASFFETPELAMALSVAAVALPIRSLKTPGMFLLAREINYRPIFKLTLWQKSLSFITVITIAFVHPSHWAIIVGTLVSSLVLAIGSYRVHDFRPRWTLVRLSQQWRFSQWLLLRGIVGFTRSQIDNLMVSKIFGVTHLGGYNLVREVSLLPALSAIIPMTEPLLAAIAQSKADPKAMAYRIRLSLALLISALLPLTTFMMIFPELIVRVLLGPQWSEYAHLLQPFGLFFFTFCLFALISDAVIAQGKVKALFFFDAISTLVIIGVLLAFATESLGAMAWFRGWLAMITTAAILIVLNHWAPFNLLKLAWLCLPAVAGTAVAASLTLLLDTTGLPEITQLLIRATAFVVVASASTLAIATLLLKHSEEWLHLRSLVWAVRHET